jgi:8-oxo-dGTP diphosphatase
MLSDQVDIRIDVRVEVCALTVLQGQLSVVVTRADSSPQPQAGPWRLLGGPLLPDVDADTAARSLVRIVGPSTSVVEQLRTYSPPLLTDHSRTVTVAYFSLFALLDQRLRTSDTVRVFAVDDLLAEPETFIDAPVLIDAVERVRAKLEYTTIATSLLPEPFTVPELRRVYEAVWGVALHPANFRRKVLATEGFVVPARDTQSEEIHPGGPDLFQRGVAALLHPAMLRT